MKSLKKAKLALRKHLLENKEQVVIDLEEMRNKSKGTDIHEYIIQAQANRKDIKVSKD